MVKLLRKAVCKAVQVQPKTAVLEGLAAVKQADCFGLAKPCQNRKSGSKASLKWQKRAKNGTNVFKLCFFTVF